MTHIPFKNEEEAIKEFDERYKISDDSYSFDTVCELFEPDVKEIKDFISKVYRSAYELGKKEERECIWDWAIDNGITDKKSFVALRDFINKQN